MSESKHTPGPWSYDQHDGAYGTIYCEANDPNFNQAMVANDVHHTNARLISAAPDMLEAAEMFLSMLDGDEWEPWEMIEEAARHFKVAIAKAKGEK